MGSWHEFPRDRPSTHWVLDMLRPSSTNTTGPLLPGLVHHHLPGILLLPPTARQLVLRHRTALGRCMYESRVEATRLRVLLALPLRPLLLQPVVGIFLLTKPELLGGGWARSRTIAIWIWMFSDQMFRGGLCSLYTFQ